MKLIITLLAILFPLICAADVYEQKEANGIVYSDTPLSNGVKIDAQSHPMTAPTEQTKTAQPEANMVKTPTANPGSQSAPLDYVPTQNTTDEKPFRLPEPNAQSAEVTDTASSVSATAAVPIRKPYLVFDISAPKDGDTIANQPSATVTLTIEPALQTGDLIQLYYDGKPYGQPAATTAFDLATLERGVHQVYAVILSKGTVIKQTSTITLNVQRVSIINKNQ